MAFHGAESRRRGHSWRHAARRVQHHRTGSQRGLGGQVRDAHPAVRLAVLLGDHLRQAAEDAAAAVARDVGLSVHLDGERAFNAAIALGIDPKTLAQCADSVSVCLSKGLGTPAGSVLCGPKSLIQKAHRYRKMLGGGMRQVGILAAAGLYALEHHAPNLAQDHQRAEQLRLALSELPGLSVDLSLLQTNMVLLQTRDVDAASLVVALKAHGVIASGAGTNMRLVVHRDINDDGIDRVIAGFRASL